MSKTVNSGDAVSLAVTAADYTTESRWRKDGGEPRSQQNGLWYLNISDASTTDSGLYECHFMQRRGEGIQAFMRLIVRGKTYISASITLQNIVTFNKKQSA